MPLNAKGQKIMDAMIHSYGRKKAEQVFYAARNAGKITAVDPESSKPQGLAKALPPPR